MRDYIHVFVNIDHDLDGYITIDNFRKCFSQTMSNKWMNDRFWDDVAGEYRLMDIGEFLEIMKPKECTINKDVIRT